jgi:hypothetical protein
MVRRRHFVDDKQSCQWTHNPFIAYTNTHRARHITGACLLPCLIFLFAAVCSLLLFRVQYLDLSPSFQLRQWSHLMLSVNAFGVWTLFLHGVPMSTGPGGGSGFPLPRDVERLNCFLDEIQPTRSRVISNPAHRWPRLRCSTAV